MMKAYYMHTRLFRVRQDGGASHRGILHIRMKKYIHISALTLLFLAPLPALAATSQSFEVTGWIPYWRTATGTADVLPHLSELTEVDPFVYTLKSDGTLLDNGGLNKEPWLSFIAAAKAQKVRVIPTVMTSNTALIHSLLSNTKSRIALETRIAAAVKANGFDGIDIDFEGKSAADKNYFSTFLKGLYQRMGNKWVMCSIESRTPNDARYYGTDIPPDASIYANDFTQINKYCDRVRLMTYDQQGVDQALASQAASSSTLYAPVADPLWVEKVVNLAAKSIKRNKILIGVPTYGYEYDVTAYAGNQYTYDILWTFNPGYATQIEQQNGVVPMRNSAGEMQLTYFAAASSTLPVSSNGVAALVAASAASAYANALNSHQEFHLLDWPDAQSIAGKAELAQTLGIRGISIFKLDGGEDPGIWTALLGVKQ
jgi:spore germination protein YaaH